MVFKLLRILILHQIRNMKRTSKSERKAVIREDDIWNFLPHYGKHQFAWLFIGSIMKLFEGITVGSPVFLMFIPIFSCFDENDTAINGTDFSRTCPAKDRGLRNYPQCHKILVYFTLLIFLKVFDIFF